MMAYATLHMPSLSVTHPSAIITELDSIFDVSKKSRRKSIFEQCLAWHVFLSVVTLYAQNSVDTNACHSNPSRSLLDYSTIAYW